MNKKILAGLLAAMALFASCEKPIFLPVEMFLEAEVEEVGLTSIEVSVKLPESTPFYITQYTASDFEKLDVTAEKIIADYREKVSYGANWASILKVGPQTVRFDNLQTDTDYKVIVFGLNGLGEMTLAPMVLDARTEDVTFELELKENSPFAYTMEVSPSRDDIGWYAFSFMGAEDYLMQRFNDSLVKTYIEYFIGNDREYGATYDEIAKQGQGIFEAESYPDLAVLFTVVAVDKNLKIVSKVKRYMFLPDREGFIVVDEKKTKNLHTLIYAYNHDEMGVLLHVTGHDGENQGVISIETSINGRIMTPGVTYPFDLYQATDDQIAFAMAEHYQKTFDEARHNPDFKPYFDQCTSPQQMMELLWLTPQNYYDDGRVWDRNAVSDLESFGLGTPDEIVFALGINKINARYQITPAEYCISRCKFSDIGYSFTPSKLVVRSPKGKIVGDNIK